MESDDKATAAKLPPQPPLAQLVHPSPSPIIVQTQNVLVGPVGRTLIGILGAALVVALLVIAGQAARYQSYFQSTEGGAQEKFHSGKRDAQDKIAILAVEGAILKPEGFVKQQIDQVLEDDNIKGVVLRVDSPGGTVTASDYIYHHLQELKRKKELKNGGKPFPLVVSMGSLCASGGYYVAMAVGDQKEAIFAEPTTWTGSIGVIIPHFDASGLLETLNVKDDSIASHRWKQMGSPTRKLNDEERAEERKLLQSLVDDSFGGFKDVVRAGRPALRENDVKLNEIATGQVFTARQALERGLVDKIGFIEEAIQRAASLASLADDSYRVVHYTTPPGLVESLFGGEASLSTGAPRMEHLLELTAPRAYYMSTWLPAVVRGGE